MTDFLRAAPRERTTSAPRNGIRTAGYAVVIFITIGGVYFLTRGRSTSSISVGHDHGAMAGGADSTSPVMMTPSDQQRIGVTYAAVEEGSLAKEIRTVGQIAYDETRLQAIAPKIDGWVEQLFINATGQYVAAGDPLLSIYSPMLVSAQEELLLAKTLVRDVAVADSSAQRNAAELLASARRRLAYWDIPATELQHVEQMGHVMKALTLQSSASGYVLEKNVVTGQRIMAGDVLYRIADLSSVWVEGEVFEQDIASIRVGQTVQCQVDALPGENRIGRISSIYPTLNPQTRTMRVRIVLSNPGLRLKPGMYTTIRIDGTQKARVLTVPRSAVLATGQRSLVFVRRANGMLIPQDVVLGGSNEARVEIRSGVALGDTVVSSATFLVDAESNLRRAVGGMSGMELATPANQNTPSVEMRDMKTPAPNQPKRPTKGTLPDKPGIDHSAHMNSKKP